jgi:hypothetical protein
MAYEIRGANLVFLVLFVTLDFDPLYRRSAFVLLSMYAIYCGDLLGEVPFYAGALLADMSLVIKSYENSPLMSSRGIAILPRRFQSIKHLWPTAVALFALFVGSFPRDSPEQAGWATFLNDVAGTIFPHSRMASTLFMLTY